MWHLYNLSSRLFLRLLDLMDLSKILMETAQRRMFRHASNSREFTGQMSESEAIDLILEEAMSNHNGELFEREIVHLVRKYNSNDRSSALRASIRRLKDRLATGEDSPAVRMIIRTILRSKEKQLEE